MCQDCETSKRRYDGKRCHKSRCKKHPKDESCCKCVPIRQKHLRCNRTLVLDKEGTKYVISEFLEFNTKYEYQTAILVKADNITIDFCDNRLTQSGNVNHAVGIKLEHGYNNFHLIGPNIKDFTGWGFQAEGNNVDVLVDGNFNIENCGYGSLGEITNLAIHGGILTGNPDLTFELLTIDYDTTNYPYYGKVKALVKDGYITSYNHGVLSALGDTVVDNVNIKTKSTNDLDVRITDRGVAMLDFSSPSVDGNATAGSKIITVTYTTAHGFKVGDIFVQTIFFYFEGFANPKCFELGQEYTVLNLSLIHI